MLDGDNDFAGILNLDRKSSNFRYFKMLKGKSYLSRACLRLQGLEPRLSGNSSGSNSLHGFYGQLPDIAKFHLWIPVVSELDIRPLCV